MRQDPVLAGAGRVDGAVLAAERDVRHPPRVAEPGHLGTGGDAHEMAIAPVRGDVAGVIERAVEPQPLQLFVVRVATGRHEHMGRAELHGLPTAQRADAGDAAVLEHQLGRRCFDEDLDSVLQTRVQQMPHERSAAPVDVAALKCLVATTTGGLHLF